VLQTTPTADSSGAITTAAPMRPTADFTADPAHRLASFANWQWGAVAGGIAVAALALAGALVAEAGVVGAVAAAVLAAGARVARQALVEELAGRDDLAGIPEVARARRRLVAPRYRREVAASLRRIAVEARTSRHDVAPVVVERLAGPVRRDLLALAEELERAVVLDPRTMAEIAGLVHDGARSPLLNRAVPESELQVALRRIRFRLATPPVGEDELRPAA
jgi:hypothetical protein